MLQLGKTQVLGKELERVGVDICGLSEVRWKEQGHFNTAEGHKIIYSGDKVQGQQGAAVWINKRVAWAIIGYEPISSRLLVVRFNAKPRCISLIQVYAPTSVSDETQVEQFYHELAAVVKKVPARDILVITGDFNAKVGKASSTPVVSLGGLGDVNEAGERLLDFCLDHDLILANTWFKHHPRRLYTWTSPDGKTRNQIDYFAVKQQWKSCISNCRTYPGPTVILIISCW
jgi:exonuclease III